MREVRDRAPYKICGIHVTKSDESRNSTALRESEVEQKTMYYFCETRYYYLIGLAYLRPKLMHRCVRARRKPTNATASTYAEISSPFTRPSWLLTFKTKAHLLVSEQRVSGAPKAYKKKEKNMESGRLSFEQKHTCKAQRTKQSLQEA